MDLGLAGKTALVTGGSRGIGLTIARGLRDEGARVVTVARNGADLSADLSVQSEAFAAVDAAIASLGTLDILINNVGGSLGSGTFASTTPEHWRSVVDTNLMSAVWCSQRALPSMQRGCIVHINSICGREYCSSSAYTAAKAAMTALTKEMAITLAKREIRVNGVAPGSVMFPGGTWERRKQQDPARIQKMIDEDLPWGRFGTPEEIANVVVFLCSPKSSWVTGATIPVDGAQGRAF